MTTPRTIAQTHKSVATLEGAGVHLHRAIGFDTPEKHDPFLLLDDFRSDTLEHYIKGFPWHPHRGIDTITYVLKGEVEHGDSIGNSGVISGGDVQWMTAGSGIVHQEMPKGDKDGSMHGFQLWLNLPATKKMCHPKYRDISHRDIPQVKPAKGVLIRVICGTVSGVAGPVCSSDTMPQYADITLSPNTIYSHPTIMGHTAMAYVIAGTGCFDPTGRETSENKSFLLFNDGASISVHAGGQGMRFLFFSGKPLNEPIAWQGPIVMNTKEQLHQAFEEYQQGTFLKHD